MQSKINNDLILKANIVKFHRIVFHFYSMESYRVVHEGLETADDGGVDGTLTGFVIHVLQKLQQALQSLLFNEPCHKAKQFKRGKNQ